MMTSPAATALRRRVIVDVAQMERFDRHIRKDPSGCWIWTGQIDRHGYGHFQVSGRGLLVHRVAYERFVAPIPDGLVIDHLCRVPACLNPEHLEAVTNAENARRGLGGPGLKTHCTRGHLYDEANTKVDPKGHRRCRACACINTATYRERRRAA